MTFIHASPELFFSLPWPRKMGQSPHRTKHCNCLFTALCFLSRQGTPFTSLSPTCNAMLSYQQVHNKRLQIQQVINYTLEQYTMAKKGFFEVGESSNNLSLIISPPKNKREILWTHNFKFWSNTFRQNCCENCCRNRQGALVWLKTAPWLEIGTQS